MGNGTVVSNGQAVFSRAVDQLRRAGLAVAADLLMGQQWEVLDGRPVTAVRDIAPAECVTIQGTTFGAHVSLTGCTVMCLFTRWPAAWRSACAALKIICTTGVARLVSQRSPSIVYDAGKIVVYGPGGLTLEDGNIAVLRCHSVYDTRVAFGEILHLLETAADEAEKFVREE